MLEHEITKYRALNKIAETNGIVIFGGTDAKDLPLCELKQAFELKSTLYNRSISELSIKDATKIYQECIAKLHPETIFLQIGAADLDFFAKNPSEFTTAYSEFITNIKAGNPKCHIVITSLKNPENKAAITELNKHLKYIAESEHCEYGDITTKRVWNPHQTKDIMSFIYSTGFVRPLKNKQPVYDLLKILFCYEPSYIS